MRPDSSVVMLEVAAVLSQRATCRKLRVGAVMVDRNMRIIGSGYNGTPRGLVHCLENPCNGVGAPKGADLCEAVHAEANALLNCHDPERIYACYCTHAPCLRCTKTLLNTSCEAIIFANADGMEQPAMDLWLRAGRAWLHRSDLD